MGAMHQALLMAGNSKLDMTYQFSTASTTTSHTISSSAQVGDLVVLHCYAQGSGGYSGATPSGWTQVAYSRTTTGTGAVWGVLAYKVLVSGDPNTTLTGLPGGGAGQGSTMLYYRPSKAITLVTLVGNSAAGDEATTGDPAQQNMNVSFDNDPPYICVGGYISNGAITTRTSSVTMSEITEKTGNPYAYVKHKTYNIGDTLEYVSVDMADFGNNCLQSFYLKFD